MHDRNCSQSVLRFVIISTETPFLLAIESSTNPTILLNSLPLDTFNLSADRLTPKSAGAARKENKSINGLL